MRASLFSQLAPRAPYRAARAQLCILLCTLLLLIQGLVGCAAASQAQVDTASPASQASTDPATPTTTAQTAQTPARSASPASTPTSGSTTPALVLHGPTNFLLNVPFDFSTVQGVTSDANGATISLDPATLKKQLIQELHHMLFVVDGGNNIKVYTQGASPISAQLTFNDDGSASITYTQTANSEAGTVSIFFAGMLSEKRINVQYEQQYKPSIMINAQSSDVVANFSAPVQWVTAREIPAAPGNGSYQMTGQGGIALSWSPGQNAVAYDVYRLISDQNQQFQLLATVKGTTYIDNSAAAMQNVHATKGITYAIFSVGPTGVENPGGIIISA
ncbi:MAG TPA: hypothetical protein VGD98_18245 [Ktedonobacteraceae bacterium]